MKRTFPIFLVILSVILSACAASPTQSPPLPVIIETSPALTIAAATATAQPVPIATTTPQVFAVVVIPTSMDSISAIPNHSSPASYAVTLNDNGKAFHVRIGDNILLDLGANTYDWNAEVDNQSALKRRIGNAQMFFDALNTGSANLTAAGNPKCINSTPPCMMPSIMFRITVVVQ